LILFDLDGTLIDSNGVWIEVDEQFLGRYGFEVTEEYRHAVGHSIFPVAAQYTKEYFNLDDSPEDIMAEWHSLAEHHYYHTIPLKQGAAELLAKYKAEGIPLTLFTASVPKLCRAVLERHKLTQYFDHLVFAQEIGLEKHDPRCFNRLCELIGVLPEECTLFDDSVFNCSTARASGMNVVGVYDRFYAHHRDEMQTVCTRYVHSLEELL